MNSTRTPTRWAFAFLAVALAASACEREPLDLVCTELQVGDLAISEIRGLQTGTDTWGQWIEIYNPTSTALSLRGLTVSIVKLDGSDERTIWVRDEDLSVPAYGYVVLGRFSNDDLPAHADYGYQDDFSSDLYRDGLLRVFSCGEEIDRVVYHDLPNQGTLAFDGALALTAQANDAEADWCVDDAPAQAGDGGTTMVGLPGTPREANRPCP